MTQLELQVIRLDRAALKDRMSANERSLFFLLGHVINEINVLTHLLIMVSKGESESHAERCAESGQATIITRLLISKAHEAWELFKARFQADKEISKKFAVELELIAGEQLSFLKAHFGKGSVLTAVRNNLAAHYTDKDDLIERAFNTLPETEPLLIFTHPQQGNSFYYASELIASMAMVGLVDKKSDGSNPLDPVLQDNFEVLIGSAFTVSGEIAALFGVTMALLCRPLGKLKTGKEYVDAKKMIPSNIRYYFDMSDFGGGT